MYENWDFQDELQGEDVYLMELRDRIREIPLSNILEHHGVRFAKVSGGNIFGYCPFHPDTTPNSFSVNNNRKICKCFACGNGGDAIAFMQLTENLSYSDAILKLAADENLITKQKFEELSKKTYSDENLQKVTGKYTFPQKKEKPSDYIKMANDVYSLFPMLFGLSEEDAKYLKEERRIEDSHMGNYFTIGDYNSYMMIYKILKIYPEYKDELKNLAGFYEDLITNHTELAIHQGIGLLIRNANGFVVGVQIRRRHVKEGELRYVWLTSSFALYSKYHNGGSSPGAPIDIIVPEKKDIKKIAIVEGKFKSEILSQNGFISASVQGVGNFAGIEKEIEHFPSVKTAYIFYDADMLRNTAVLNQAIKLGKYLNEKCPNISVKYCVWKEELGKGIDDLIINGHKDTVKVLSQETFTSIFQETITPLMEKYGVNQSSCRLSKEERVAFGQDLKESLSKKMF